MSRPLASRISQTQPYTCIRCSLRQRSRRAFHATSRWRQRNDVLTVLEERGLVNQIAGDRNGLDKVLQSKKAAIYAGIDPTAPSLHLGHLLPLMVLFWLSLHGNKVVSLIGGATARVGDPSGRLTSRTKTAEDVQHCNFEGMWSQTEKLLKNVRKDVERYGYKEGDMGEHKLLDNAEWLDKLNVLDFLKMLGNGTRIGTMLGRDTVRNKMERGDGMSFSEFAYPLLQGWDWWHMYRTMGVQIQVGGSDQYGNIVAGTDAVRNIAQNDQDRPLLEHYAPMGLTTPLLLTASGEKFGKSAGNAVWLDRSMTSPFDLYGFLLRSSDADVERYLKIFTFVPMDSINAVMKDHVMDPGKRKAQHLLAVEVVGMVHGREDAKRTQAEHQMMRNPNLKFMHHEQRNNAEAAMSGQEVDRISLSKSQIVGMPIAHILHSAGLAKSKSDGVRMVEKGGVYVASHDDNAELSFVKITDTKTQDIASLLVDNLLILRLGKWKVRVIEVLDESQQTNASATAA